MSSEDNKPIVLPTKKPDDDFDTLIGVLLSFAMLWAVWHFSVHPHVKKTLPQNDDIAPVVIPKASDVSMATIPSAAPLPVVVPAPAPVTNVINNVVAPDIIAPAPKAVFALPKPKPIHIETVKPKPKPAPVLEPVVVTPPPAPVVQAPEPVKQVAPTPPPAPVVDPANPKVVVRESIEFGNGSARLPASAMPRLLEIAALLKNDSRNLKIVGHTDNIGSSYDNKVLSLRRANAVKRFLVFSGVPAGHLTAEGAGADEPITDNSSEASRQRNRRIEITEE
jgi:outer membrane protein OmpA-like peptidoglycan-associated protein